MNETQSGGLVGVVEDFEVEADEVFDEENDNELLLDIDSSMIEDLAIVVANVIIQNIEDVKELEEQEPGRLVFFMEEIQDAVESALETCDFTKDNYEFWASMHMPVG